ncbi:MAG TPA: hypothetical protein PLH57_05805 [Oligoflexia bacterium]|nr:hypothetical protein [Oligoflexia bacterium]
MKAASFGLGILLCWVFISTSQAAPSSKAVGIEPRPPRWYSKLSPLKIANALPCQSVVSAGAPTRELLHKLANQKVSLPASRAIDELIQNHLPEVAGIVADFLSVQPAGTVTTEDALQEAFLALSEIVYSEQGPEKKSPFSYRLRMLVLRRLQNLVTQEQEWNELEFVSSDVQLSGSPGEQEQTANLATVRELVKFAVSKDLVTEDNFSEYLDFHANGSTVQEIGSERGVSPQAISMRIKNVSDALASASERLQNTKVNRYRRKVRSTNLKPANSVEIGRKHLIWPDQSSLKFSDLKRSRWLAHIKAPLQLKVFDQFGRVLMVKEPGQSGWSFPEVQVHPDYSIEELALYYLKFRVGLPVASVSKPELNTDQDSKIVWVPISTENILHQRPVFELKLKTSNTQPAYDNTTGRLHTTWVSEPYAEKLARAPVILTKSISRSGVFVAMNSKDEMRIRAVIRNSEGKILLVRASREGSGWSYPEILVESGNQPEDGLLQAIRKMSGLRENELREQTKPIDRKTIEDTSVRSSRTLYLRSKNDALSPRNGYEAQWFSLQDVKTLRSE